MVRATHDKNESSGVLPTGGPLEVGLRGVSKVVDEPISTLDRQRRHIVRKVEEPSKIFIPLDPSELPRHPTRGKNLHTDPFAENRPHFEFKRAKAKVQTPRGQQRPQRRVVKPVAPTVHAENKKEFIASNGTKHSSPKRVVKEKHMTTHQNEQPPKSFVGSQRFALNPDKKDAVRGTQGTVMSTSDFSISNVFNRSAEVSPALSSPPRVAVKPNPKRFSITMEGVFSPMRSGLPPKPSDLAPWMKDQRAAISCKKANAASIASTHTTPYAIEAKK